MDLRLFLRVLWRFKFLLMFGLVVAAALAFLSYVKVSYRDGHLALRYRQGLTYSSATTLLITQRGFPLGSSVGSPSANPQVFAGTAQLYAQLATSDPVRALMLRGGPIRGSYSAVEEGDLPILYFSGTGPTREIATNTVSRAASALIRYVTSQQNANRIPGTQRIVLQPLTAPYRGTVLTGRSRLRPIAVFLVVMLLFVVLAFVLENIRPSLRPVAVAAELSPPGSADEPLLLGAARERRG